MKVDELVFKGLLALIAMSIGVNSYFVKLKVDDISSDIKSLSESYYNLRVENASRDALLNSLKTRIEILEAKADRADERLRSVEIRRREPAPKHSDDDAGP